MSRSETPAPLWLMLAADALTVGALLWAVYGRSELEVSVGAAGIALTGLATVGGVVYLANKRTPNACACSDAEAIETLRRENAENLRLLQEDLHNLGQAVLKRLPQKGETSGDAAGVGALAATVSAVSADMGEVKSTVYEMQAQLDQLNDSLLAAAHPEAAPRHLVDDDVGPDSPPADLARALAKNGSGAAISRLIAGSAPQKPEVIESELGSTDIEPAHPEGESTPVLGGDLGTAEQSPDPVVSTDLGEFDPEWDDAEFAGVDENEPELDAFAPVATAAETESTLTETEESADEAESAEDTKADPASEWLTAGLDAAETDDLPALPVKPVPVVTPASQPELLALDEPAEPARKPKRPAKGQTGLIAHMMIGIGNKPYLRGIGPGLSTEVGVPMDYVDVGTWQWICPESDAPVALSIWKNDEEPSDDDLLEIHPGEVLEIHPRFDTHN